jgi:hypothetical protein
MKFTYDWLKDNCQKIHYFGLGFIQLKVNKHLRLHFYTACMPPIVPEEDIHNHRYDFTSWIIRGALTQEFFTLIPGDTHVKEEESCQEGVKPDSKPEPCSVKLSAKQTMREGSEYFIDHDTFHRVKSDHCITMIERTDYKKPLAQVVRPVGETPVCPFSQKIEEEVLWRIVRDMI